MRHRTDERPPSGELLAPHRDLPRVVRVIGHVDGDVLWVSDLLAWADVSLSEALDHPYALLEELVLTSNRPQIPQQASSHEAVREPLGA